MLSFQQYKNRPLYESISKGEPIIVVDIQPAYEKFCDDVISNDAFIQMINNQENILWFFNGDFDGLTNDNINTLKSWLLEYGITKKTLKRITFKEKSYGFLRGWMDNDVPYNIIIKVIREMYIKKKYSSDELDLTKVLNDDELELVPQYDSIGLTDIAIAQLKKYSGFICGGGAEECLREIELLMSAFNFKCKRLQEYIY